MRNAWFPASAMTMLSLSCRVPVLHIVMETESKFEQLIVKSCVKLIPDPPSSVNEVTQWASRS